MVDRLVERPPGDLIELIAEQGLGRGVLVRGMTTLVHEEHRRGGVLGDRRHQLVLTAQLLSHPPSDVTLTEPFDLCDRKGRQLHQRDLVVLVEVAAVAAVPDLDQPDVDAVAPDQRHRQPASQQLLARVDGVPERRRAALQLDPREPERTVGLADLPRHAPPPLDDLSLRLRSRPPRRGRGGGDLGRVIPVEAEPHQGVVRLGDAGGTTCGSVEHAVDRRRLGHLDRHRRQLPQALAGPDQGVAERDPMERRCVVPLNHARPAPPRPVPPQAPGWIRRPTRVRPVPYPPSRRGTLPGRSTVRETGGRARDATTSPSLPSSGVRQNRPMSQDRHAPA